MSAAPALLLGIDIGGTKSAAVLGDAAGRIIARHELATGEPDATLDQLIAHAQQLCEANREAGRPVAAGVSVGSPLDRRLGLIQAPANLPTWIDVPVVQRVRDAFNIPVNLENDADAGALAEWRWGLHRRIDDLVFLTCGTGQGGGLILGGRLHRGVSNLAGEIGHVRLRDEGPVGCNKAGSVEAFTCGRSLTQLTRLRLAAPHDATSLDAVAPDELTGKHVADAARAGDALARSVIDEIAVHLGHTCAILIDVLNPQRISLGSLVIRLGDMMLPTIRRAAEAEAMPRSFAACTIEPAALGEHTQDLAALAAAISDTIPS